MNENKILFKKTCPKCHKDFKTEYEDKLYCNDKCGKYFRQRRANKLKWYKVPRLCKVCGDKFEPKSRRAIRCNKTKCNTLDASEIIRKKKYAELKFQWMQILKEKNMDRCENCGYDKFFGAIDFHHKNGTRKLKSLCFSVIMLKKITPERIKLLENLTPLCATCHRELHIKANTQGKPEHLKD